MKTMSKRVLSIVMVLMLFALIASSCKQKAPVDSAATTQTPTTTKMAAQTTEAAKPEVIKPVTLRAVLQAGAEVDLMNNSVLKRVEEVTGITLDIEAPPSANYWDRTRVIVASGDYPDFMAQGTDVDLERWAGEGILADITEMRKEYPNLMKNISEMQWGDARALSTGKIHAVPRPNSYDRWGYMINQEWLDNLGLKAPSTVDEFLNVVRAFTKDDPNRSGRDDTYGVSFGSNSDNKTVTLRHDFLSTAYHISAHPGMPDADGNFRTNPTRLMYLDYLDLFKLMWEEDIVDREFITQKGTAHYEKLAQDRVGIIGNSDKDIFGSFYDQFEILDEDLGKFTYHQPLKLNADSEAYYMMPPSNWMAFHIFSNSDKIDDVLRFLDFANSEEGYKLFAFGVEGEHYTSYDIDKRQIVRTEEQRAELRKVLGGGLIFANAFEGRPGLEGGTTPERLNKYNTEVLPTRTKVTEIYVPFVKQLFTLGTDLPDELRTMSSLEVRYITGDISKEEVIKFIEETFAPKVKPYEDIYNEFMKANPVAFVKP